MTVRGQQTRRVLGWVVGICTMAFLIVAMVFPVFMRERGSGTDPCLSNLRHLALAVQMYVAENDQSFPAAGNWCDLLEGYVKNETVFDCPHAPGEWDYAYNLALDGLALDLLTRPDKTVVVFESDAGRNAAGGPELLPGIPRHLGGDKWGFADGSARWLARKSQGTDTRGDPIWLKETESPVQWEP